MGKRIPLLTKEDISVKKKRDAEPTTTSRTVRTKDFEVKCSGTTQKIDYSHRIAMTLHTLEMYSNILLFRSRAEFSFCLLLCFVMSFLTNALLGFFVIFPFTAKLRYSQLVTWQQQQQKQSLGAPGWLSRLSVRLRLRS